MSLDLRQRVWPGAKTARDEVESERKRRWLTPTGLALSMGEAMEPPGDS